jgi:hypothetical protein
MRFGYRREFAITTAVTTVVIATIAAVTDAIAAIVIIFTFAVTITAALPRSLHLLSSSPPLPLLHKHSTLSMQSLQTGKRYYPLHLKVNVPSEF